MDIALVVQLLGLVAIAGIVWWFLSTVALPQPARIVVGLVFALLAIAVIGRITGVWGARWFS